MSTLGGERVAPARALRLASLLALCATLAAPSVARADPPSPEAVPLAVVALSTDDAFDQAEALSKALREAALRAPGWSLAPGDYALGVLALSLKCPDPPDAACQARIGDEIKADRFVWGTARKGDEARGTVRVDLHLWARGKGVVHRPLEVPKALTDPRAEALRAIAADALRDLTGGPPRGGLRVRANAVGAEVFVDGQPLGALTAGAGSFSVPIGLHRVTVKALGYTDHEAQVRVLPTAPADVDATLTLATDGSTGNGRRIAGGVTLGAGVAFGVVGLVSSILVARTQTALDDFRLKATVFQDVCAGQYFAEHAAQVLNGSSLRDACTKGRTFEATQAIFYPLAVVAGGVGIVLLTTAGKASPSRSSWELTPLVGPRSGALTFSYRFQ